jgi:hypothetical protein
MKKIKVVREIDLSKRDSVRDAIIYLNHITKQLKEIWRRMDID